MAVNPTAQHRIHVPASSTKLNQRLFASCWLKSLSERSIMTPRNVTRKGTFSLEVKVRNCMLHTGATGGVYTLVRRKGEVGAESIFGFVFDVEHRILIVVRDGPFPFLPG